MGLQRPTDQSDALDPGDLGDSLSELREARLVRTPEAPRELLVSDDPVPRAPTIRDVALQSAAIVYPEWDYGRDAMTPQAPWCARFRCAPATPRERATRSSDTQHSCAACDATSSGCVRDGRSCMDTSTAATWIWMRSSPRPQTRAPVHRPTGASTSPTVV